ncbi:MAG: serine/threonine protein kinase, partial [Sandaracinus sp.]|nr:serine/threonine protein kinase [Sandaracinus sp.]
MNESDRQSDPLLGRTLGGVYAVERRLGTGGFGAVYAGRHLRTGRRYALKVLRPDRALVSPEARERFRREAEALASLGHAGIVAVHDYASSDGFDYLVMDLLEGEDLASRLAAGPLPLSEALRIVEQIADALSLAHHQGIVHRDLKPANVFLARERTPSSDAHRASQLSDESTERAVLLDFGLAKSTGGGPSLTASGEALGTPQYMAPEQASGDHIDARTDVYALGAILFEMLSGHPPFDGPSPAAVLVKSLTTPAPSLRGTPGVPSHVADAVAHALAKEPDLRPASATDFVAYLRAERPESLVPETRAMPVVGARSTERPPPTRVSDAQPMSRPFPWLAVSIATIAVCIVGVLAYVATRPGETDLPTAARAPSNEAPSNE